ncbi:phosphoglucosamine mutase [Verrucomicrobia bacterium]|nr:phosphoglucosamine mutase [Verrucomicrobiota bacterium]
MNFFGTDGIRGPYGGPVINECFARSLGSGLGSHLIASGQSAQSVLLGRDTRPSGESLQNAFGQGLQDRGFIPLDAGIIPTPALSSAVMNGKLCMGAMITASHNPSQDNGFKLFSGAGEKLSAKEEELIESQIDLSKNIAARPVDLPKHDALKEYVERLVGFFPDGFLKGYKVVADLANGATIATTAKVLAHFGAEVLSMHEGEGIINEDSGSEHPKLMQEKVRQTGSHFGLAHDGDGDRVVFADEKGLLIHGDRVLGLLALDAGNSSRLKGNGLVATEHSNSGLGESLRRHGFDFFRSPVGDRNVSALMKEKGCNLGGESSGHVVSSDYLPTGDGLYTALLVAHAMARSTKTLQELARAIILWPSKVGAIVVKEKIPLSSQPALAKSLEEANLKLGQDGRILLRYSGTEPKIRLLVEGKQEELVTDIFCQLSKIIEKTL